MSMQPMFTIQRSARSSLTSGYVIIRFSRDSLEVALKVLRSIHSGMCLGASFWKKNLPSRPSG
jgi:hypothetical protein